MRKKRCGKMDKNGIGSGTLFGKAGNPLVL